MTKEENKIIVFGKTIDLSEIFEIHEVEHDKKMFLNREAGFIIYLIDKDPMVFSDPIKYESTPNDIFYAKEKWRIRRNEIENKWEQYKLNKDKKVDIIAHLTTEVSRLREATKQKYLDGFTEGYQMAIEDIQEGNPLNKVYKSNQLDFYKKLLAKLDLITSGELNLVDYKSEVVNKVQAITPSK